VQLTTAQNVGVPQHRTKQVGTHPQYAPRFLQGDGLIDIDHPVEGGRLSRRLFNPFIVFQLPGSECGWIVQVRHRTGLLLLHNEGLHPVERPDVVHLELGGFLVGESHGQEGEPVTGHFVHVQPAAC
jgi:hypothetical protein